MDKQLADKIQKASEACLANAEACLSMAERELGKDADHLCFHLALLSLEEIGKSILIKIGYTVSASTVEKPGLETALDDHVKKIFWALWHGFLMGDKMKPQEIEQLKGLATGLHESRLDYLYTDPNNPIDPKDKLRDGEVRRLIDLARLRLKMERETAGKVQEFTEEETEGLKWFFTACEDKEKRVEIFNHVSIEKLKEFGNGKAWIEWLYDLEKKNREEMMRLTQLEISRKRPETEEEMFKPKYKVRFRVQSQSHTIRDNAFDEWNKNVKDTKIYKSGKKELPIWAKSELIIDLTLHKGVSPAGIWEAGFSLAKTFVNAINIGTMGLFWWNMPKDVEGFYDEIIDLEADPTGRVKLTVTPGKRLMINWGDDARLTLKKDAIGEISLVAGFLMMENQKIEEFMQAYAMGMTCLSKTDIHLRLEPNAFDEFFKAFKSALKNFGDWDGTSDIKESAKKIFPEAKDMESILQQALDLDPGSGKPHNITLTEVVGMKIYCDAYIKLKAREYYKANPPQDQEKKDR